jgi:hypothetical protein
MYYRAEKVDTSAWDNTLIPKPCRLIESFALCEIIALKNASELVARKNRRLNETLSSR